MSELFNLPPAERAKRYREFAAESFRLAEATPERVARQSYLTIAEQWKKRADAIERNIAKYGTLFAGSGQSLSSEPPREAASLS